MINQQKIDEIKIRLFEGLLGDLQERFGNHNRPIKGRFGFIPIDTDEFVKQLDFVINRIFNKKIEINGEKLRFLDAGCGVGVTVCIARKMGLNARGIEINPKLIELSSYVFNKKECITEGDIIKFTNYHNYDIIYYYCPLADNNLEIKFEKKVEKELKIGGVIIANQKLSNSYGNNKNFKEYENEYGTILKKIGNGVK